MTAPLTNIALTNAAPTNAARPDDRRDEVVRVVVGALAEVLGHDLPEVTEETRLFDDLNVDSTSVLGLLMGIEDGLDLEIDTDLLEQRHLESVGAVTDFVLDHL